MATKPLGDADDAFRASVVGASECSALFDANPYLTHFELYHRKTGDIATPEFGGNERIEAGIRLEPVILDWACDKWGYKRATTPRRLANGKGLGGHPDMLVDCSERGRGILECKTADWLVAKSWGDEPPLHYQLQAQAYAGLAQVEWVDLVILVGGNELRRFQMEFRPKVYAEIERRVEAFWQSVEAKTPPKADYTRDLDPLKELYRAQGDETVDLKGDNRVAIASAEYLAAAEDEKAAKARKDAAQAEIIDKLKDAAVGFADGFIIKSTAVASVPDREAEPGEIIRGRRGYRRFTIKERS